MAQSGAENLPTDGTTAVFLPLIIQGDARQAPPLATDTGNDFTDQVPPLSKIVKTELPIDTKLWTLEQQMGKQELTAASITALQQTLVHRGITMDNNGKVHIAITAPEGSEPLTGEQLLPFGADIGSRGITRIEAWLPVHQLSALAQALPAGHFLEHANEAVLDQTVGQGPGVTNSDDYQINGARTNCAGMRLAVIDAEFHNLTAARTNGDAPPTNVTTQIDRGPAGGFESGDGEHGTGVVEALFDHCPGAAAWRLYRIDEPADLAGVITDANNNNIQIIVMSMSYHSLGYADDTGEACAAVRQLGNNQLFFVSAGNRADSHWQGAFNNPDNDKVHNFATNDESISVTVPDTGSVVFDLAWDRTGGTHDYDLYLLDATNTTVLDRGELTGDRYESVTWTNDTGAEQIVNLVVQHFAGGTPEFEVFMRDDIADSEWNQYQVAAGSTASPSNCISNRLISVGAVAHDDYGHASGLDNIQPYSSQGPTNGGRAVPHLVGPTHITTFSNDGFFGGTSAATPNAAGVAAAFWASIPNMNAMGVAQLLRRQAEQFNDWGAVGVENTYGSGGIELVNYVANTTWAERNLGNLSGSTNLPYFYISHAQTNAPTNGRVVILAGNYVEPITLNKPMTYQAIGTVVLGQ